MSERLGGLLSDDPSDLLGKMKRTVIWIEIK